MSWSIAWKSSTKPAKQKKYRFNAPEHIKRKMIASHLSKELKKKYNRRSVPIIVGDKIKIVRGQYKGVTGKVEAIRSSIEKIQVSGIEVSKKDGSKSEYYLSPTNVIITELKLDDKKRKDMLARTAPSGAAKKAEAKPAAVKPKPAEKKEAAPAKKEEPAKKETK